MSLLSDIRSAIDEMVVEWQPGCDGKVAIGTIIEMLRSPPMKIVDEGELWADGHPEKCWEAIIEAILDEKDNS